MTYKQLGKWLQIDPSTISVMVRNKEIPHIKLGRRTVRFRPSEITDWLELRRGAGILWPPKDEATP